jgi:hypothetical protein
MKRRTGREDIVDDHIALIGADDGTSRQPKDTRDILTAIRSAESSLGLGLLDFAKKPN